MGQRGDVIAFDSEELDMILDNVIGGAGELSGIQVMGAKYQSGISGVIFVKVKERFERGMFMLKFRGVMFRDRHVSAKYAQREFDEESLARRDLHQMNEGNKLLHGDELRSLVLADEDDPSQRWSEGCRRQLQTDGPMHWNWEEGERVMADGTVLGLPRIPAVESSADVRRREDQAERHGIFWKGRGKGSLRDHEKGKGGSHDGGGELDTMGDEVSMGRVIDKYRVGLCRRCGLSGHDKYELNASLCRANPWVRCMQCGVKGHCHRACNDLGFSWEKGHLANPARVKVCEDEHFG
jgi:hypothetical protein